MSHFFGCRKRTLDSHFLFCRCHNSEIVFYPIPYQSRHSTHNHVKRGPAYGHDKPRWELTTSFSHKNNFAKLMKIEQSRTWLFCCGNRLRIATSQQPPSSLKKHVSKYTETLRDNLPIESGLWRTEKRQNIATISFMLFSISVTRRSLNSWSKPRRAPSTKIGRKGNTKLWN